MEWERAFNNYRKAVERNVKASELVNTAFLEKRQAHDELLLAREELRAVERQLLDENYTLHGDRTQKHQAK
jgi:hypothetical protein